MKAALTPGEVGSNVRPKSTSLEKAIIELENICRLPSAEVQDPDNLPRLSKGDCHLQ
ncbi:hypothetical protein OROMI_002457 [Orobanche minor]